MSKPQSKGEGPLMVGGPVLELEVINETSIPIDAHIAYDERTGKVVLTLREGATQSP